jgi:hypothetical protein
MQGHSGGPVVGKGGSAETEEGAVAGKQRAMTLNGLSTPR